jgi:hypothetical protein
MKEKKLLQSFKIFQNKIGTNKQINWVVFGSFRLLIEGIKITPSDIDILTTKKGAYQIAYIFKNNLVTLPKYSEIENIRSLYFQITLDDITYDIVGDLQNKIGNKWVNIPSISHKVYLNQIPVLDLTHEYETSIHLNDLNKAKLIRTKLNAPIPKQHHTEYTNYVK